ncbi:MAG: glycosyltransferase [Acidobacteriota bacterium]|nr:glycosyltransferase [Acidobacteriota bacterium]
MKPEYKILLVTNMWPYAGDPSYGAFIKEQVESLAALGVEYDLLFINGRESKWNYARGVRELHRMLRKKRYDLVHAHFGLAGCVARLQARAPLVVTFHGDDVLGRPKRNGRITTKGRVFQASSFLLARSAMAVIVQSEEMRRKLRLPRAEVIPCGIDLDLFQPVEQMEARAKLGLPPDIKYVLFPYNPAEERKRFEVVEEAVRMARRELPNLEILLVKGRPHSEMPFYMNAADVLVMASLIEGSPVAAKEAMAVNLPIISVRVGDMAELIGKTEGCYLVDREPSAIAAKILEVCQRGERTHGREVIANRAMDKIASQILEVYARVAR